MGIGRVSVLVINWNTRELLRPCLSSVLTGSDAELVHEVVVVDNGSTDGSADEVAAQWPGVTLIRNTENLGYTKATNQGLAHCTGEHVLLLNTDAWPTAGALRRMVGRMDTEPRCAVVGPRLEYGDGSWQRWTAGAAPDVRSAAAYLLFLDRMPRWSLRSLYLGRDVAEPLSPAAGPPGSRSNGTGCRVPACSSAARHWTPSAAWTSRSSATWTTST